VGRCACCVPLMAKIKAPPITSGILTAVYIIECICSFFVLRGAGKVYGYDALHVFPAAMGLVLIVLTVSKAIGRLLSRNAFGANRLNARKFGDQTWQFLIHLSMTFLELYVLQDETWYSDAATTFHSYDADKVEKDSVQALYLIQLAIWVITCFSHHFLEARHKDYVLMYMHHIVTIALITLSWFFHFQKVGVIVLYVHDASDITIDLLKMFNYLKLEVRMRE